MGDAVYAKSALCKLPPVPIEVLDDLAPLELNSDRDVCGTEDVLGEC